MTIKNEELEKALKLQVAKTANLENTITEC